MPLAGATAMCVVGLTFATSPTSSVRADDHDGTSSASVRGVRLRGLATRSSVSLPRSPRFAIVSSSPRPRRIALVRLASLGPDGEERTHVALGSRRFVLAPHARREIEPDYEGDALMAQTSGLGWRRFRLRITVDGTPLEAIATTAYMCRIPLRPFD